MCSNLFGFPKFYLYIGQDYSIMMYAQRWVKGVTREMKKIFMIGLLFISTLFLFACGSRKSVGNTKAPVVTKTPEESGKTTVAAVDVSDTEAFNMAEELVKNMSLEEKVGQMFLVSLSKLDDPRGQATVYEVSDEMLEKIRQYHIGGVILGQQNIKNQRQTRMLTDRLQGAVSGAPLYVAVEEDGGGDYSVSAACPELKAGGYMVPEEMGRNMTSLQVYQKGLGIGNELRSFGINMVLGPVADVAYDGNKKYGSRCFSSDPDTAAEMTANMVKGYTEAGVAATMRYFPGNGMVSGDTTLDIQENKETLMQLRDNEFSVYSDGMDAGAGCIMVSNVHMKKLVKDKVPAFMSQEIVTKLLRDELGFDKVVLTSSLSEDAVTKNFSQDYAIVEAVNAGCDVICQPQRLEEAYQILMNAVRTGNIDEKVINTAVCRILTNKITGGVLVLNNNEMQ